jgi:16S rRNA (guanine(966)-N(2))-methyltransferase RsmD
MKKNSHLYISSGFAKGRKVVVPTCAQPIKNIVKESIFSTISSFLPNTNCLDLFAGSGILGIEALSRGAKSCAFVDQDKEATANITKCLTETNLIGKSFVARMDNVKYISNCEETFDIIFFDPPYKLPIAYSLKNIWQISSNGAVLILLRDSAEPVFKPENFRFIKDKVFGKTRITYFALDKGGQFKLLYHHGSNTKTQNFEHPKKA